MNDLKAQRVRSELNLKWFEFPITSEDREFLRPQYAKLINLDDDPSAGFLRFHVNEYVEWRGKLSPRLADWLVERIAHAPRCYRVKAFEEKEVVVNHEPPKVLGLDTYFWEKEWSRRYWSSQYPERSWDRMENRSWPSVGEIIADPRTFHPEGPPRCS